MMKDKNTKASSFWRQPLHFSGSTKRILIFLTLLIFLILSGLIIWKQHLEKAAVPPEIIAPPTPQAPPAPSPSPNEIQQAPQPSPIPPQSGAPEELKAISDRLSALETKINQQQVFQTPQKLVTAELFRGVLEGWISLDLLKSFLQKNPEPWAQTLFGALAPIKECKTYSQLKMLLSIPPSEPLSTWDKIKRKIKSLIRIRKLDSKGNYQHGDIEDVQSALERHDIQHAIEAFEKLCPEEKNYLSSWKMMAQDRLTLETLIKKFLTELSEG